MRLRTVQLENYRRYKSAELEFPDGLVSIIGPNGSGKSTLMEAVAWALFGNQTEIVRTGKDSIKRQGAAHSEECRVRLEFDFEDTGYVVERTMKGKNLTMNATVQAGQNIIARGSEEVSQALMGLFGMDHKSFFISVFARQKELNALTSQPRGERKKMVLRLLDIESVDEAIRRIREDARYAKNAVQAARDELVAPDGTPAIDAAEQELEELAAQEKELRKSGRELDRELKNIEAVHKKLRKELGSQEMKAKEQQRLVSARKALEAKLSALEEQGAEMSGDLEQLEELETELKTMEKKAARASKDLEGILDKRESAANEQEDVRGQAAENRAQVRQIKNEIKGIKIHIEKIEEMGPDSDCPTCERRLGETYDDLLNKYGGQIEKLESKRQEVEAESGQVQERESAIKARLDALGKRERLLQEKAKGFEILRSRVERLEKLRDRRKQLGSRLKDARGKLEEIDGKLSGIEFDQESYDRAKKAYEDMNSELRDLDRKQMSCQSELARLEERQKARKREMERLKKLEKRSQEKLEEAELLGALEDIMKDFRRHLISRIRPALSSMSSELLSVLTDGRYNEISLDEDYEISIRDEGEMHELDRFSGGEKDLANLCLRLAISEIIATRHGTNSFDMVVLDEIFGSQDANRKRALLTTLNGLSNRFKQIFLITHVEDVKELMGNVIRVSEGPDGTSIAEVMD